MDLDRIDVEILRALQGDARRSFRDLARAIGVSVPTVSARVANLEQLGVLTGYHASIDAERLGQVPLVLILRCTPAAVDRVGQELAALPEVRWSVRTQGSRIVAQAVLPRPEDVRAFLGRVRKLGGVVGVERHLAAKRIKDVPRALLPQGLRARPECFECGRVMEGEAIKRKLDGRNHYFCCASCEGLYLERYARIKGGIPRAARKSRGRGPMRLSPRL